MVKLTDEESEWLFGINAVDAFANPELIREHFPKAIGILVTAGKKGAAYWLLGQIGRVPVFDVQVTETTGGEIFFCLLVCFWRSSRVIEGEGACVGNKDVPEGLWTRIQFLSCWLTLALNCFFILEQRAMLLRPGSFTASSRWTSTSTCSTCSRLSPSGRSS